MTNEALKSELRESAITMANLPTEFGVACITEAGAQRISKALTDAATALEAMEAGGWLPLDSAPKDGAFIHVQQQATYRWLPYKQASQEFKRGKKGRWQKHTGYGFDNADLVGSGWMNAELPTPPKEAP